MLTPTLGCFGKLKMKIIFIVFVFLVGFIVYKFISKELKKSLEIQKKILNDCKTEEERTDALNNLKRNNIKKSIIFYFTLLIFPPIICLALLFLIHVFKR